MTDCLNLQEDASKEPSELSTSSFSSQVSATKVPRKVLNTHFTEENALVCKILKTWARSKFSNEKWNELDCETKFNNIFFNTTFNTSSDNIDDLVCKVTCFCKSTIKITKTAKSSTKSKIRKSRWVSSNFQTHFLKHFRFSSTSASEVTLKNVPDKPTIKAELTANKGNKSNKITKYFNEFPEQASGPQSGQVHEQEKKIRNSKGLHC